MVRAVLIVLLAVSCLFTAGTVRAAGGPEQVDVELVIAVDVSGSMSDTEHRLQRDGFLAAFADDVLLRAIQSGPRGQIAVTYVEWADAHLQKVLVPWQIVRDRATADAFRAELARQPRTPIRGTSIAGALTFSANLFAGNGYDSFRKVIDVSGDGPNRTGDPIEQVRDRVVAQGIVINGLPIMISPMLHSSFDGAGLDQYFADCVIGGPGAFVYPVKAAEELSEAIRRKLIIEVSGVTPRIHLASDTSREKIDCAIGRRGWDDW